MPYTHSFLTRGNGHRILISDIQLLQWYSRRRDIRHNPLPYSEVQNAVMDLLANRETPVLRADGSQLLITRAFGPDNVEFAPPTPAVIQHAVPILPPAQPPLAKRKTALILIPPVATLRADGRQHTKTQFYKPYDILAKELNFLIALCQLHIPLELPSIIMEDNSAVVTMANNDSGYTNNKHFLMVLNYIKEQISLEQIEARKIYGKLNTADMHTKPLRSPEFLTMAHKILGHPPPLRVSSSTPTLLQPTLSAETVLHGCEGPTKHRGEAIPDDTPRDHH